MGGNRKVMGITSPNKFKNRRTSLNVNLSYISSTSLLTEDDTTTSSSSTCDINLDESRDKTVLEKPKLPVRRNLSLKRFIPPKETTPPKIKPSYVRMVRISTSTPLTTRNKKTTIENGESERISEETFIPSENSKLSSILEDVRFPLVGEIFCPTTSVVMETSMDLTEVQGAILPNLDPVMSEECPDVDRSEDSFSIIQDTDDLGYNLEHRLEAVIIPDSEQDSIKTTRTSLNVNTSIDSRFSSIPNNSIYDPRKDNNCNLNQDNIPRNELESDLSQPATESSYGTVPINSLVITRAVIEREDQSNENNDQNFNDQTTINLLPRTESSILHDLSLHDKIQSINNKSIDENCTANDSSSTEASSSTDQDHQIPHLRISSDEDEIREDIVPKDLGKRPISKGKKKLFVMRRSEMVDLSPVAANIRLEKPTVPKKRINRRNKTAKKILNKENTAIERAAKFYSSDDDDDIQLVDPEPRKEKKVRKLKAKKIVIKKKANLGMWKMLKENSNRMNESCDDISSALERTSLDDFEPKNNLVRQKIRKIRPKIIIVATGLSLEQKLLVKSTVTILGSAKLDKIVTRNTTHVVSKGTRTVNLLRGMLRGCWLVNFEWISKSLEAEGWVDPEKYEITSFSKAVQENRKERQLFGKAYVSELFLTCGLIHIKEETSTPASVLKDLVRIAGGRVTEEPEDAKIIIGRGGFKEIWILDSITNGEIQPLEQYCKKKCLN